MRALVAGGGQIGTFAAASLQQRGVDVEVADRDPSIGYFARYGPPRIVPVHVVDLTDPEAVVDLAVRGFDAILLCAGPSTAQCAADPDAARRIVDGMIALVREAGRHGALTVVVLSSIAVYGGALHNTESVAPAPTSAYGRLKRETEERLLALASADLRVLIARSCGVYGPTRTGSGSRSAQLVESLLIRATSGMRTVLRVAPGSSDEYLYVKDLAGALTTLALEPYAEGWGIFNVGTATSSDFTALAHAVRRVVPAADVLIEEIGDRVLPRVPLDISRITETFGFVPRYDLAAGLEDFCTIGGYQR